MDNGTYHLLCNACTLRKCRCNLQRTNLARGQLDQQLSCGIILSNIELEIRQETATTWEIILQQILGELFQNICAKRPFAGNSVLAFATLASNQLLPVGGLSSLRSFGRHEIGEASVSRE